MKVQLRNRFFAWLPAAFAALSLACGSGGPSDGSSPSPGPAPDNREVIQVGETLPTEWKSNTIYQLTGGHTYTLNEMLNIAAENLKISTSGTGNATIQGNYGSKILVLRGKGNTVENLNLVQLTPGTQTGTDVFALITQGGPGWVNNVHTTGGYRGINVGSWGTPGGTGSITHCSANTTASDGIYIDDLASVEVRDCKVWNVALGWPGDTGGDCLQFDMVPDITVDGCYLDHTNDGKFCLIALDVVTAHITNTVFKSLNNSACIYAGADKLWNIQNCRFQGGVYGIQNSTHDLIIDNCLFKGQTTATFSEAYIAKISHCTFVDSPIALNSWSTQADEYKEMRTSIFYNVQNPFNGNRCVGSGNLYYNPNRVLPDSFKAYLGADLLQGDPAFTDVVNYQSSRGGYDYTQSTIPAPPPGM